MFWLKFCSPRRSLTLLRSAEAGRDAKGFHEDDKFLGHWDEGACREEVLLQCSWKRTRGQPQAEHSWCFSQPPFPTCLLFAVLPRSPSCPPGCLCRSTPCTAPAGCVTRSTPLHGCWQTLLQLPLAPESFLV